MTTQGFHAHDVYTIVDSSPGPVNRSGDDGPGLLLRGRGRSGMEPATDDLPVAR
jgi:hypothetical protein